MKKQSLKYLSILVFFFVSGCGPDFGDKIYDWVENNAHSYSEKLTHADLKVRWLNQFTEHYRTIGVYQKEIGVNLNEDYALIEKAINESGFGLEKTLKQYDQSRMIFDRLLEVKSKLDQCDYYFSTLDSIGSLRQFEAAGLRAIGKETLLRSFFEAGDRSEKINRLRYEKLFSWKYTLVINENGDVDQEISHTDTGGKSYSGNSMGETLEKFFADFFVTAPFVALMNEDKLEEQKEIVMKALDRFDELCLTQKEQFEISTHYVEKARALYAEHHHMADSIHQEYLATWQKLFDLNESIRVDALAKLAPYRKQLAEEEFRGQEEIQRILDEEERFEIRQEIVNMIEVLIEKKTAAENATDTLERIRLCESFHDAVNEGQYILSTLHNQQKYLAIHGFIERYQARLETLQDDAIALKNELKISQP